MDTKDLRFNPLTQRVKAHESAPSLKNTLILVLWTLTTEDRVLPTSLKKRVGRYYKTLYTLSTYHVTNN